MEVFIEPLEASPAFYMFGAGHVGYLPGQSRPRGRLRGARHRRSRRVCQPRPLPLSRLRVVDDIPAWLARPTLPPSAYAVIVTRGHRNDLDALERWRRCDLRYLGLIGSRAKVARLYERCWRRARSLSSSSLACTRRSGWTSARSRLRRSRSASPPS